jgi:hypothetical protein
MGITSRESSGFVCRKRTQDGAAIEWTLGGASWEILMTCFDDAAVKDEVEMSVTTFLGGSGIP